MKIYQIPIDRIEPNPWQPRLELDEDYVKELAQDIAANGLIQPPTGRVLFNGEALDCTKYDPIRALISNPHAVLQIVVGHNRVEALRVNGAEQIPMIVGMYTDSEMMSLAYAENNKRRDISPYEDALAIQRAINDFEWTQEKVAKKLGIGRSSVANKLRLLGLPKPVLKALHDGEISARQAESFAPIGKLGVGLHDEAQYTTSFKELLSFAKRGWSSDDLRKRINTGIVFSFPEISSDPWLDLDINGLVVSSSCAQCPKVLKIKQQKLCTDVSCRAEKEAVHKRNVMNDVVAEFVLETGVRAEMNPTDSMLSITKENKDNCMGCEHLRYTYRIGGDKLDFPGCSDEVKLICIQGGACACSPIAKNKTAYELEWELGQIYEQDAGQAASSLSSELNNILPDIWYEIIKASFTGANRKEVCWDAARRSFLGTSPYSRRWDVLSGRRNMQQLALLCKIDLQFTTEIPRDLIKHMLNKRVGEVLAYAKGVKWNAKLLSQAKGQLSFLDETVMYAAEIGVSLDTSAIYQRIKRVCLESVAINDIDEPAALALLTSGFGSFKQLFSSANEPTRQFALAIAQSPLDDVEVIDREAKIEAFKAGFVQRATIY